jgi:sterol desaturase/sphingolipid hydroxylase (fatty acid hydroxylase superfamily)
MPDSVSQLVRDVMQPPSLQSLILFFLGVGLTFGVLERLFPANKRRVVRPGIGLDLFYWVFTPVVIKMITGLILTVCVYGAFTILGWPIGPDVMDGFGPLAQQPVGLQIVEVLILADFIGYWMHRWFHVTKLWRFHAVHHSPKHLDWISAYRMHPFNDAFSRVMQALPLLLLGYPPKVLIAYVPFIVVFVVFLHTNIRWTFGPLKYVISSPTFHRWHHASEQDRPQLRHHLPDLGPPLRDVLPPRTPAGEVRRQGRLRAGEFPRPDALPVRLERPRGRGGRERLRQPGGTSGDSLTHAGMIVVRTVPVSPSEMSKREISNRKLLSRVSLW